ncbi:hypothetical protein CAL7716_071240 [Calothrix sp. PCC 7716]|nr:hypothetical protein CAL7716_071240 [Calothrix sp. PCC 7716]
MRQELLLAIEKLSDTEYQSQNWLACSTGKSDCFDNVIHFLYDHAGFDEDSEGTIGLFVRDKQELTSIMKVIEALEILFKLLGTRASDADYISSPAWLNVVETAKKALEVLRK